MTACRPFRRTRTRCCTPDAWWPSAAFTAWTRTRWPSIWPSCRSGWRRWRRITPSPLKPTCEFLLDYEEDEDEEEPGGRQRRKPWRYRWPDDLRDEVLARLLELNKRRAEQEKLAGPGVGAKATKGTKGGRKKPGGGEA